MLTIRSTKFAAEPKFQSGVGNFPNEYQTRIPLSCSGKVCIADPMLIKGKLVKPVYLVSDSFPGPEGASTPDCLFNSANTGWTWTLEHFLWQATTVTMVNRGGLSWLTPTPVARTLEVVLQNAATGARASCNFTAPALDGDTNQWWPCYRDIQQDPHNAPQQRVIQTYVQFSARTGVLAINQTWYCNDTQAATPWVFVPSSLSPFFSFLYYFHLSFFLSLFF